MTPAHFNALYLAVLVAAALALLGAERVRFLQRDPASSTAARWIGNLGLWAIGVALAGLVLPAGLYAFAAQRPPGALAALGLPTAIEVIATFLLLDLWRYWEHRIYHGVPILWRCHLVHHSDTRLDVTTSERHHPLEVMLGLGGALLLIVALGLPAAAVAVYLLAAGAVNLWSHANVHLPPAIDSTLRWVIATPAWHAIHHSDQPARTDSNFGAVLTIWDRLFGTYVDPGPAKLPRYGLEYFHGSDDARLGHLLLQPFRYRATMAHAARADDAIPPANALPRAAALDARARGALAGALAGTLLVSLAMAPTWLQLVRHWRAEPYQYAWLVIPTIAYLVATRRGGLHAAVEPRPGLGGVFMVVVAALIWSAGMLMGIDVVGQGALVLALHGVAMAALGTKAYRSLFPVLALLFLMVPAGDILLPVLMTATVQSMALFPILAGLPYGIDGFVITVAGRHYVVVEACSGLALVTTATFLGYSIGLLMFRSPVRALLLALFSATLAFLCNAARVNAIVIIDYLRGSQMEVAAHTPIQWLALAALLAGLFYVVHRTASDKAADRAQQPARSVAASSHRFAPVIAGAAGLLVTGSVLAFASDASLAHAPHRSSPPSFAGWAPGPEPPAWADDAATGIRSLRMTYVRGGATLEAAIVEAATPAAKLTEAVLLPADTASWHRRGASARQVCAQGRCLDVVHATWVRQEKTQWRHAYYLYSTGSFASGSKLFVRAMHGWQRLTRAPSATRLVGLVTSTELDPAEATAVLQGLLAQDAPGARAALD